MISSIFMEEHLHVIKNTRFFTRLRNLFQDLMILPVRHLPCHLQHMLTMLTSRNEKSIALRDIKHFNLVAVLKRHLRCGRPYRHTTFRSLEIERNRRDVIAFPVKVVPRKETVIRTFARKPQLAYINLLYFRQFAARLGKPHINIGIALCAIPRLSPLLRRNAVDIVPIRPPPLRGGN